MKLLTSNKKYTTYKDIQVNDTAQSDGSRPPAATRLNVLYNIVLQNLTNIMFISV